MDFESFVYFMHYFIVFTNCAEFNRKIDIENYFFLSNKRVEFFHRQSQCYLEINDLKRTVIFLKFVCSKYILIVIKDFSMCCVILMENFTLSCSLPRGLDRLVSIILDRSHSN